MSSVAKTACMRTAYQERRQLLHNPEAVLMGYLLHDTALGITCSFDLLSMLSTHSFRGAKLGYWVRV